jgi:uncharacterized protein (TIGR03437 family)
VTLSALPASSQTIATIAGNGNMAFSGDGGLATNAALNYPKGIAIDAAGNVYIADPGNFRVRKVNTLGIVSTYAGNGVSAYTGDGGQAVNASISDAMSVATDAAGNLYIADSSNRVIRRVTPAGVITTIAGTGTEGFSGDGGPAAGAMLGRPVAVVVDGAGNLYYADSTAQRIRRISAAGIITTIAGAGAYNAPGFAGDGGPAISALLATPLGLALSSGGNIYVADADNNRVRMITAAGIISTVAGDATEGFAGDGGPAVNASINIPSDVAVDNAGNLYIADAGNNRIRVVNAAGIISTIAGIAGNGFSGDGGLPTLALLNYPWSVAVSSSGTVYLGDRVNDRVREIQAAVTASNAPAFPANGIVNGASFAAGLAVAPGSLAAIFGTNLASSTTSAAAIPLPTALGQALGQTSVTFNGVPAPLFFVSAGQINVQVPFTTAPGPTTVQVTQSGMTSTVQTIGVAAFSPGLFLLDQAGDGAIFHALTFGIVSSSSPARTGEAISIYATGLGAVSPSTASGSAAASLASTITQPTVTIGGVPCNVLFSGLAPGLVSVYQINVAVPAGLSAGNQAVRIGIGVPVLLSNTANVAVLP